MADMADDIALSPQAHTAIPRVGGTSAREARAGRGKSSALRGFRLVSFGLAVTDAVCAAAALAVSQLLALPRPTATHGFLVVVALAPFAWIAVFQAFALYRTQHLSASEEFRRIISATSVGTVLIMIGISWWQNSLSRAWLLSVWSFALLFELLGRRLWRWRIGMMKRNGRLALRTLVVGANDEAARLARALELPVRGFVPVGFAAPATWTIGSQGLPVLGGLEDLERTIREHEVECVFVASSALRSDEMVRVSRACRLANVEMRISANLPDILTSRLSIQPIHDIMALSVKPVQLTTTQAAIKRTFDVAVASLGLVLSTPLMAAIALAIRVTSPGPILFKQERVTKGGRVFTMHKFRTMVRDADRVLDDAVIDLTAPFFKMRDDPRLTWVGRVIRPFSLDELPQLWNVIRGDMSLVGPRPLRSEQVASGMELLSPRHEVKAGLTGWWQINGRNDVSVEQSVRLDLFYIENWSLSLDLYVLLKSVGVILAGKGAY